MISDSQTPTNGAVIFLDFTFRQTWRLEFDEAMITELQLPGLDGHVERGGEHDEDGHTAVTRRIVETHWELRVGPLDPEPTVAVKLPAEWHAGGERSQGSDAILAAPLSVDARHFAATTCYGIDSADRSRREPD